MKKCSSCAEVEIIEFVSPSERFCWLCTKIETIDRVKRDSSTTQQPSQFDVQASRANVIPPGWYRDDATMQLVTLDGQRRIDQEVVAMYGHKATIRFIDENTIPELGPK